MAVTFMTVLLWLRDCVCGPLTAHAVAVSAHERGWVMPHCMPVAYPKSPTSMYNVHIIYRYRRAVVRLLFWHAINMTSSLYLLALRIYAALLDTHTYLHGHYYVEKIGQIHSFYILWFMLCFMADNKSIQVSLNVTIHKHGGCVHLANERYEFLAQWFIILCFWLCYSLANRWQGGWYLFGTRICVTPAKHMSFCIFYRNLCPVHVVY